MDVPHTPSGSQNCTICHLPVTDPVEHPLSTSSLCPFCDKSLSRLDSLRRHAKSCPQRQGRKVPRESKRGRKPRACNECSRVRVFCDGKAPCGRCASRHHECTYKRACTDISHRLKRSSTSNEGSNRLPLPFLVTYTDPNRDFFMEQVVAGEPESRPIARSTTPFGQPNPDFIDPMLLFCNLGDPYFSSSFDEFGNLANLDQDAIGIFPHLSTDDSLGSRFQMLATELEALALEKPRFRDKFDINRFRDLFSSANIHDFAATFSRKRHYQAPVIHWPTFDLEAAPLPLLLAVALNGAAYSHSAGTDLSYASRAREFYWVADAYIFRYLKRAVETWTLGADLGIPLQLCQAGILMYAVDSCVNDDEMRRNCVTARIPSLVHALRRFGICSQRHDPDEVQEDFIQKEKCNRLASWCFYVDSIACLFTNSPPNMSLSEMSGHLPCSAELWDAESADEFDMLRDQEIQAGAFFCLQDLVSGFMEEEWPGIDSMPYKAMHFWPLHAVVCAFQPIIYNLHTSPLHSNNASVLLRAFKRWKLVWDATLTRLPAHQRKWMGLARNGPEVLWLSTKIVQLNELPIGKTLSYFDRKPGYDAVAAHELIRELRTNPALRDPAEVGGT